MKSELIAGSLASAKGIWLNKLGNDFHIKFTPIPILTDNQSTIAYSKNKVNNSQQSTLIYTITTGENELLLETSNSYISKW